MSRLSQRLDHDEAPAPAETPVAPYYAVIFTSVRSAGHEDEYRRAAARMLELARKQPGFIAVESARERLGITVSYWTDLEAIAAWRRHAEHEMARRHGRERWYRAFTTRVARVEREHSFGR